MEQERYSTLSIKEYADICKVSAQAIYKRLDTDLKPYLIIDKNGKKRLTSDVLQLNRVDNIIDNQAKTVDNQVESTDKDQIIKDQAQTIKDLTEQITALNTHIMKQSADITEILKQQAQLQENYQIMLSATTKLLNQDNNQVDNQVETNTNQVDNQKEHKKRHWWSRKA